MDQEDANGETLLSLTTSTDFIDPDKWQAFYDSVNDILSGEPIAPKHRGLLPFRVWQIFDEMCGFAAEGEAEKFVCAAGVLCHYVGDACQPSTFLISTMATRIGLSNTNSRKAKKRAPRR
jgi:hypothetical protein